MSALEQLRTARRAERRWLDGDTPMWAGWTWYQWVNYWRDRAQAEGYSKRDILAAMQVRHPANEGASDNA